jgi:4-oxalocrotonate tautomerase
MWPGRSHEQKRQLAKAITDAVVEIGKAPAEATFVIFEDVPKENWAQAGTLASDE